MSPVLTAIVVTVILIGFGACFHLAQSIEAADRERRDDERNTPIRRLTPNAA